MARQRRMEQRVDSLMRQQTHQRPPNAAYPADSKVKFGALSAINEVESSIYVTNPHQRGSSVRAGSNLRVLNASQERQGSWIEERPGSHIQGSNINERSDMGSLIVINTSNSSIRQSHPH